MDTRITDRYRLRKLVSDEEALQRFYRFMDPGDLVRGGVVAPHWMADGSSFWYSEGLPPDAIILHVDGETGRVAPLFDVAQVRAALGELLGSPLAGVGLPFDTVNELGPNRFQVSFGGRTYLLSKPDYRLEALKSVSQDTEWSRVMGLEPMDGKVPRSYQRHLYGADLLVRETPSPDQSWYASIRDGNIWLRAAIDGRAVPLTTDGSAEVSWDIEGPRYRFTAGLGLRGHQLDPWSPDGNQLFAIKMDRRGVRSVPFIRYLKPEEEVCLTKVSRAGGPLDVASPHVFDVLAKRARRFELGVTEDQFFTLIGWLPDASEVLFTRHTRDFKTVDVLAGNPTDGSVRTVLSESATSFVAIQHEVIFSGDNHVSILADGSGILWRSVRSGWNHFYFYDLQGKLHRPLTAGEYPVLDLVSVDPERGWVYFTAHHDQERPYDTHFCRVRLQGGPVQRLTRLDGENVIHLAPSHKTFVAINSRTDRPFRTDFHRCDGEHLCCIQHSDLSALRAVGHANSEEFTVKAADGETRLWGVMHKPADFDPSRKYPLIDHIYGGPQVTMVRHDFGFGQDTQACLDRALAQLGYIVVSVDARGTPERSKAFHDVVYANFGRHEIPDHVTAIRQLAERHSFIDLDRVGLWGHSLGGYFAIRGLAQAPDVFKVAVASAPATSPYDLIIFEPYLDLPIRSRAAYDYADNNRWASQIRGHLLLIAGTADCVRPGILMRLVHHLIQAGVEHELVMLPENPHAYLGDQNEEYFVFKLLAHFERHLKRRLTV